MVGYNLIEEIYYEGKFYYITDTCLILECKPGVSVPNHPAVSLRHNKKDFFNVVDSPSSILKDTANSLMLKHGLEDKL